MKTKNKYQKLSKKDFMEIMEDIYKTAKKDKAGILNINLLFNEKYYTNVLQANYFNIEDTKES